MLEPAGGIPKILISISTTNPTYQLYIAISWVTSSANIKIFNDQGADEYMRNVIYREVLKM
jgi:hypothetical protein